MLTQFQHAAMVVAVVLLALDDVAAHNIRRQLARDREAGDVSRCEKRLGDMPVERDAHTL